MPAKELGTKHLCFKCGTRFYDLKKPEPICPKCGADQRQSPVVKPAAEKRVRAPARPVAPVEPAEAAEAPEADEDAEADDDDDEDEAEEDDS
ncbi:MAG TPA: TIGR02300 family protein [Anaeromyxobacter sp.]